MKGTALFTIWTGKPHRATRDIDFLGSGDSTEKTRQGRRHRTNATCETGNAPLVHRRDRFNRGLVALPLIAASSFLRSSPLM